MSKTNLFALKLLYNQKFILSCNFDNVFDTHDNNAEIRDHANTDFSAILASSQVLEISYEFKVDVVLCIVSR